jgi:hypothetical protein
MKRLLVILVVLALALPCLAQTPPPKPGPEVQKLAYFLGTWKGAGEVNEAQLKGKSSGIKTCEWFAGGFHLMCRTEATGPQGRRAELTVMAYDEEAKGYTWYMITSDGFTVFAKGSLTGSTLTWQWEEKGWGKPATFRITQDLSSPTSLSFLVETSAAGGPWTVIEKGKASKVK